MCSIGDIGLTKSRTTLFFDTKNVPAKVFDDHQHVVCYYAKQVMDKHNDSRTIPHQVSENQHPSTHVTTNQGGSCSGKSSTTQTKEYWYFFSPLYFGESPVACITTPEWCDGIGTIVPMYTFKRMYSGQVSAEMDGYFGGELPVSSLYFAYVS